MNKSKKIFLIIVVILVVIILTATIMITISKKKALEREQEKLFKENVTTMQNELATYITKECSEDSMNFYMRNVNFSGNKMAEKLKSTKNYINTIEVQEGKLKYIGEDKKEAIWFKEILDKIGSIIKLVPEEWEDTIVSLTQDEVPVPRGFSYVEGSKDTGVVIKDEIGNEFVWIPATEYTYTKDFKFPSKFYASSANTTDDKLPQGVEDENYDVKKYGGFYIARYEAGVPKEETTSFDKEGIPVSQKGSVVWTNISYTNAKKNAESMINTKHVQTGLLTGKAWDTTCHFIEDYITKLNSDSSLKNSTYYGNYIDSTFTGAGLKVETGILEHTKTKNIYDLAGNVWEWTSEKCGTNHTIRGGEYNSKGTATPVSYRDYLSVHKFNDNNGFRVRLYIK